MMGDTKDSEAIRDAVIVNDVAVVTPKVALSTVGMGNIYNIFYTAVYNPHYTF